MLCIRRSQILACWRRLIVEHITKSFDQRFKPESLLDKSSDTLSRELRRCILFGVPTRKNHPNLGTNSSHFSKGLFPIHVTHRQVQQHRNDFIGSLAEEFHTFAAILGGEHVEPHALKLIRATLRTASSSSTTRSVPLPRQFLSTRLPTSVATGS